MKKEGELLTLISDRSTDPELLQELEQCLPHLRFLLGLYGTEMKLSTPRVTMIFLRKKFNNC